MAYNYRFQNPDAPLGKRVDDLVAQLTTDEKINLMTQYQAEIPRLGIKAYKHGTEGAHGIAWLGEATMFPQNIGLACTWNPALMKEIGSAIGDEARVFYQRNPAVNGLTVWAPTVDMERDPRWGRTEEAYGEDPHLTGEITSALIRGMQGDDPFYLKTVATLKHFIGNNNEAGRGSDSVSIDARNMREYYLRAFEKPFRKGGALSMMTSYNAVNGTPANFNPDVNGVVKGEWGMDGFVVSDAADVLGTVRDHKYMASYAEAVARSVKSGIDSITDDQDTTLRAVRDALEQGLLTEADLDAALRNTFRVRIRLGEFDPERDPYANTPEEKVCAPEHAALSLQAAREQLVLLKNGGLLPLDKGRAKRVAVLGPLADVVYADWYSGTPPYRVTPLAGIREKLGEGADVVHRDGSDRIRLRAKATGKYVGLDGADTAALRADRNGAEEAQVFRRTDWGWGSDTLQTAESGKFVTVGDRETGLAAVADEARGWFVKEKFTLASREDGAASLLSWNGKPIVVSGADGALAMKHDGPSADVDAVADAFDVEVVSDGLAEAVEAARGADAAVVFVGNQPFLNGKEEIDRPDIVLPAAQDALIRAVREANPNTVVVIVGSYPFSVEWADEHVPSILYTSHAGQELGRAVADVLFGDYSPAGRLNMTWYRSVEQLPDLMDYDIIKGGRTYQYFDGDPLYPFGHGLTYAPFRYGALRLESGTVAANGGTLRVSVDVMNEGDAASDEVVQLYVRGPADSRVKRPLRTLAGFARTPFAAGETRTLTFEVPAAELAFWDVTRGRYCVEGGTYTVLAGRSAGDIRAEAAFAVDGEKIPPRRLDADVRASDYDDYEAVYLDEYRDGGQSVGGGNTDEARSNGKTRIGGETGTAVHVGGVAEEGITGTAVQVGDVAEEGITGTAVQVDGVAAEAGKTVAAAYKGAGVSVRDRDGRGWIAFHDADLGGGVTEFQARVASGVRGGSIEIRLDAPDGEVVGTCPVPPTGGRQAWTTVRTELSAASGTRSVYLVFGGEVQLAHFRLN